MASEMIRAVSEAEKAAGEKIEAATQKAEKMKADALLESGRVEEECRATALKKAKETVDTARSKAQEIYLEAEKTVALQIEKLKDTDCSEAVNIITGELLKP